LFSKITFFALPISSKLVTGLSKDSRTNMKRFTLFFAATMGALSAGSQPGFATSSDSIKIAYEVKGLQSPALVFVHGWSCDRSYWKDQFLPFSRDYKVVTIDLAGHGASGMGRSDWSMSSYGDDVAAVVNKLGLQRVILVGHSMGGDVIAEAAKRLKGRVAGLIMVDTYKDLASGRTEEQVESIVSHYRNNFKDSVPPLVRSFFLPSSDKKLVEWVANDMASAPPVVGLSEMKHALLYKNKMPATLDELKLKTIAINPDNSPSDLVSLQRYGIDVLIMQGVGHFLMMEEPERFNKLLKEAIAKIH
jgi:pimeloyl-ACP methyl ester carboxylesterase